MGTNASDYGIAIGVDHYPGYKSLRAARSDACRFHRWMLDEKVGGSLPPDNVRLVLSSANPIRPIQDDVDDAFRDLLKRVRKQGGRRFFLFFGGHGVAPQSSEVCLCLAKWSETLRNAALSFEGYINALVDYGSFQEIFAFLDCCRVWKFSVAGMRPTWAPGVPAGQAATRFVAYASEYNRVSFEDGDGGPVTHGHFSRALISGLYGAAAVPGGGVSPGKLKEFLEFETQRVASVFGHVQKSVVDNQLVASSALLGRAPDRGDVRIAFGARRRGEVRLEGPGAAVIRSSQASTGPWVLQLEYAQHLLTDLDSGESLAIFPRPSPDGGAFDVRF